MISLFLFVFFIISQRIQLVGTSHYQIREHFPPLVFLPESESGFRVRASAAILIESQSGAVLFSKNPEVRRAPASTTKMMTAIVALEKGNLAKIVKVSRRAAYTRGSSIWLKPGDRLSLKELMEGMMLRSGNDGSIAVAEGVSGNVKEFVDLMNIKAKEIGALNTNFQNPHGLRAPSHYTTTLDLALIARYGLENPGFAKLVKKKTAILKWIDNQKQVEIKNTNRLLWYLQGADGVKTGTTNEAGHCLVASATRDGKQLIAVVLNSTDRWGDCARMLEYGFEEFKIITVARENHPVCKIPVKYGTNSEIALYPRRKLVVVIKNGTEEQVQTHIQIHRQPLSAPLGSGQKLGKIAYSYRGQIVESVDLINHRPIYRKWWGWWWW